MVNHSRHSAGIIIIIIIIIINIIIIKLIVIGDYIPHSKNSFFCEISKINRSTSDTNEFIVLYNSF